jgi:signal transduction histidine kinase
LVELHGGSLRIVSREGQGTTVTCTLPVEATTGQTAPKAASA